MLCERHGIPLVNPVREDGTYDERITRLRGHVRRRRGRRGSSPSCTRPASCGTPSPTCTATRTAGAATRSSSTTRRSRGTSPRATAATTCSRRTSGSTGGPSTCATGASATGCRATSTGRSRATATGARRCRSGSATRCDARHCVGSLAELREKAGALPHDLHRPVHRRGHVGLHGRRLRRRDAPREGDDRHLVRQRLHAVRAVPLPVRGQARGRRAVPADVHMRGDRPDARLVLHVARGDDAAVQRHPVQARGLRRARHRRARPEDVEVAAATRSTRGTCSNEHGADAFRWYYLASQQPWAGYRFSAEAVHEGMRELLLPLWTTYGFYVLYANIEQFDGTGAAAGARAARARPLGALAPADADRADARADRRLRRDDGRAAGGRVGRGPLELVRAALAPALLGRRRRRAGDAARVPRRDGEAARAADPVPGRGDLREPRRRGGGGLRRRARLGPPVRLPGAGRGAARSAARGATWRSCARRSSSAATRAGDRR